MVKRETHNVNILGKCSGMTRQDLNFAPPTPRISYQLAMDTGTRSTTVDRHGTRKAAYEAHLVWLADVKAKRKRVALVCGTDDVDDMPPIVRRQRAHQNCEAVNAR